MLVPAHSLLKCPSRYQREIPAAGALHWCVLPYLNRLADGFYSKGCGNLLYSVS